MRETAARWTSGQVGEVPGSLDWLSDAERATVASLGSRARRAEWCLGRLLAKRLTIAVLDLDPADLGRIELVTDDLGAPSMFLGEELLAVVLSLSHKRGHAVCFAARGRAATCEDSVMLGCDTELHTRRRSGFAERWLLESEQALVGSARDRDLAATLVWSGKEAVLKALRTGWRRPLSSVEVEVDVSSDIPPEAVWLPLSAKEGPEGRDWHGWWRYDDGRLTTVVSAPPPRRPERI